MKKKWFIIILVLVIVAVVLAIVFINLFKERDTKALSEKLVEVSETGYLSEKSDENKTIDEYLTYLKTLGGEISSEEEIDQEEIKKISNYLDAYASYEVVIKFFAREMLFARATETYTNNHKFVEELFASAQQKADELEKYIKNSKGKTGQSEYWTAKTWSDCHKKMKSLVDDTAKALTKLALIYQKSVPKSSEKGGFLNNALSDVIFDEMNSMLKNVTSKADENENYGHELYVFVSAYLSKENESIILDYVFSEDLQEKARDLKEHGSDSRFYDSFVAGELKAVV